MSHRVSLPDFWVNNTLRALLACSRLLAWLYKSNETPYGTKPVINIRGGLVSVEAHNASVTSPFDFDDYHAIFLHRNPKHDTVSHLVDTWKKSKARHLIGPNVLAMSCAAKNLKLHLTRKATICTPMLRRWAGAIARPNTNYYNICATIRCGTLEKPLFTASSTYRSMPVSASLCLLWIQTSNIFGTKHTIVVCADDLLFFSLTAITVARKEGE